ncbi:MAG: L-aspartate oxidase [bacterium]
MNTDILIVGTGCSGIYCALQLPSNKKITIITKADVTASDSFLAQGGICMLPNEHDFDSFLEDTMKAGHYENDVHAVEIMIRSSQDVIHDLINYGVRFQRTLNGKLAFTKEGAHSSKRVLYYQDITGKEITQKLIDRALEADNIQILEYVELIDIMADDNTCYGGICRKENGEVFKIEAECTFLATGGVGGLFEHSTNYDHLTGDAIAIALKHHIPLKNETYVQIHPTTLYDKKSGRSFLISESVRGEGAKLYNSKFQRFVNELLPRDKLAQAIRQQIHEDQSEFVWEDLRTIPQEELLRHFPNIINYCREIGYDVTQECIPVVPAQHYYMGGIKVDYNSRTSMKQLYAIGETSCTGVHGRNRLASNSLLEALVYSKRAAKDYANHMNTMEKNHDFVTNYSLDSYQDYEALKKSYRDLVWQAIHPEERKEVL